MADIEFSHGTARYGREEGWGSDENDTQGARQSLVSMTNIAGALMSVALVAGVGLWSYDLMVRDVSGIPVVRAAAGEMRVRPEDPGGLLAKHQGLAVNEIAANGTATGPVDQVTLAPPAVALAEEDQPVGTEPITQPAPLDAAARIIEKDANADAGVAVGDIEIDAVIAEVLAAAPVPAVQESPNSTKAVIDTAPTVEITGASAVDGSGVRQSTRPRLRPADIQSLIRPASFTAPVATREIDPAAIPSGTRLAQLGAFESPEVARSEWQRMQGLFGEILVGKSRVVQQVEASGRRFYRLRAMGFIDLNDTRRFCSAVKAEGVDCIPVQAK